MNREGNILKCWSSCSTFTWAGERAEACETAGTAVDHLTRTNLPEPASDSNCCAAKRMTRFAKEFREGWRKSFERRGAATATSRNLREVYFGTGAKAERAKQEQSQALGRFDRTDGNLHRIRALAKAQERIAEDRVAISRRRREERAAADLYETANWWPQGSKKAKPAGRRRHKMEAEPVADGSFGEDGRLFRRHDAGPDEKFRDQSEDFPAADARAMLNTR